MNQGAVNKMLDNNPDMNWRNFADNSKSWPFEEAKRIIQRLKTKPSEKGYALLQTGYGPSGLPHIGTFGEVMRTTMVRHAFEILSNGYPTKLYSFSDDMDGMRKVPANVPNQEMLYQNIGKPLTSVPDPYNKFESFAHHNNAMLRGFLDSFGFQYDFFSSTECYKSGKFDETIKLIMDNYEEILAIMLPSLREERRKTYSPFLPVCPKTGVVLQVKIEEYKKDSYTVVYKDPNDGVLMERPITQGNCKLQWKVDWAMRWKAFDVDYEMSGKDHIENYKLSSQICRAIGGNPPENLIYELFLGEEGEKISKSKGNGLTIDEWLTYAPQESLAYFMYQSPKKAKRLFFDVIPKNVDEYLSFVKKYETQKPEEKLDNPVWHIHTGHPPVDEMRLTYNILLNLVSVCNTEDPAVLWKFITRYEKDASPEKMPFWDHLVKYAINYYRDFVKPTKSYRKPNDMERQALTDLKESLLSCLETKEHTAEEIQQHVFEVGKKYPYQDLRAWFGTLYEVLLGQKEGPRFGSFIELYGIQETITLIEEKLGE